MIPMVKWTALASVLALASLGAAHSASAQKTVTPECLTCPDGGGGGPDVQSGQDQGNPGRRMKRIEPQPDVQNGPDQGVSKRRVRKFPDGDQVQQGPDDDTAVTRKRVRKSDRNWKFESNRHERRRSKDKRFRYFFDGFWYPRPYWDDYDYYDVEPYRVSCREGAAIISERFSRVRIVDCDGRVYTYLGRRRGDTFEIKLNSRTGRIIGAREI